MAYDAPMSQGSLPFSDLPFKQQMKLQFSDMGRRAYSSAKNFGFIGAVFTGTECSIESVSRPHRKRSLPELTLDVAAS